MNWLGRDSSCQNVSNWRSRTGLQNHSSETSGWHHGEFAQFSLYSLWLWHLISPVFREGESRSRKSFERTHEMSSHPLACCRGNFAGSYCYCCCSRGRCYGDHLMDRHNQIEREKQLEVRTEIKLSLANMSWKWNNNFLFLHLFILGCATSVVDLYTDFWQDGLATNQMEMPVQMVLF